MLCGGWSLCSRRRLVLQRSGIGGRGTTGRGTGCWRWIGRTRRDLYPLWAHRRGRISSSRRGRICSSRGSRRRICYSRGGHRILHPGGRRWRVAWGLLGWNVVHLLGRRRLVPRLHRYRHAVSCRGDGCGRRWSASYNNTASVSLLCAASYYDDEGDEACHAK